MFLIQSIVSFIQSITMTTTLSISPGDSPPLEIYSLARLCTTGDIIANEPVHAAFCSELDAYYKRGYQPSDLWPVLLTAVKHCRPGMIKLLLSHGLPLQTMHVCEAVKTGSKEVFEAFLASGWDLNEQLGMFNPPVLA